MSRQFYDFATVTFTQMLTNLIKVLDKAADHAKSQGLDPDAYVEAKLAPDMFPLKLQIQVACVQVNDAITIFTNAGEVVRPGACTDTTLEDLKARMSAALANVASATPESFEGAETRVVDMPLFGTKHLVTDGESMLRDWTFPHFYFAMTTAYDILRHEGVPLGKPDFAAHIGAMIVDRAGAAA
ncbi:MAG TPA: DUF1993 domain-containing protein [Caulobacteraceae bacterium]|jgi:hypothetical protein|nr:DUF1993 domain-containing protein [Caulobacteraceae bacterium]